MRDAHSALSTIHLRPSCLSSPPWPAQQNRVAPAELEGFLLDHADISDAGVIGVPDEAAGELPLAFISLSSDAKQRIASASSPAEKEAEALRIKKSVMQFVKDNKVHYKRLCDVQM